MPNAAHTSGGTAQLMNDDVSAAGAGVARVRLARTSPLAVGWIGCRNDVGSGSLAMARWPRGAAPPVPARVSALPPRMPKPGMPPPPPPPPLVKRSAMSCARKASAATDGYASNMSRNGVLGGDGCSTASPAADDTAASDAANAAPGDVAAGAANTGGSGGIRSGLSCWPATQRSRCGGGVHRGGSQPVPSHATAAAAAAAMSGGAPARLSGCHGGCVETAP
eukprot:366526-Chlamydomonas_euryale.AAC.4